MDPATSDLAQVVTIASSIVGVVVYLQRAQMAMLTKLAELLKTDDVGALCRELRRLDDKVDAISVDVGILTGRMHSKRPADTRASTASA